MSTTKLGNYVLGHWQEGSDEGKLLRNAINGEAIAMASTAGISCPEVLEYGRKVGGSSLRKMTFRDRGLMLKKLALHLHAMKDKYYTTSYKTGATKIDSWIDIEGGIGNLFANASLRRKLQDSHCFVEGEASPLSKDGSFIGQHIMVPKEGIAVHINAFNFPIWGMLEKIAVNLLAGVPALVKPATLTSFLTEEMVRDIIASEILPEGSLQLLCGSARDILDGVDIQDVVTFTGSATTGKMLKSHPKILENAVPFNMEADSLNSSVLGLTAEPGSPEFDLFIKEVRKEMTVKCGQKCTAIRRIFVPEKYIDEVQKAIIAQLKKVTIGDPSIEGVRMGSLAGKEQLAEVRASIEKLLAENSLVYGDPAVVETVGGDVERGAFISPVLMRQDNPFEKTAVHDIEAFGPASTIIPYKTIEEAALLTKMGKGSLCASIATYDSKEAKAFVLSAASHHGRILVLDRTVAKSSTGHGSPLPTLVHGGPGRAGGGEEMGGMRGVKHYLQRCAVQGSPTALTEIGDIYQQGGAFKDPGVHPFRKHFEDLTVGETVVTHKRTITDTDIINFANVSWDHFYAHTDVTSLEGTTFEKRVAHGYFILSAAAGLFVDPAKGPVLLNYGIENCRFTKPIYAGATIGVKFTVKEKMRQEKREDEDFAKGIVKFFVEVYDETDETVAIATILTMIKMKGDGRIG